jgi:hypothetical protein
MTGEHRPRFLIAADEAALQNAYRRYFRDCHELADTTYLVKPFGLAALRACIDAAG